MRNVAAPVLYGKAEMPWTGIFSLSAVTKKKMDTGSKKAVWERGYMKIAYKAFRPDLSCQAGGSTYQYQLQKWNEIKEAKCRETGFHCAEDPLDCLSYYPVWEQAVYYMVAADGDIDEDACDSKIACTRLRLLKKMTKEAYIYVALVYMVQHPTRNWNANVKRERAVADRNQMAVSRGKNPTAKGGLGAVLGLAREAPDGCGITEIAVCVVDGKRYLPDVYYDVNGNEVLI